MRVDKVLCFTLFTLLITFVHAQFLRVSNNNSNRSFTSKAGKTGYLNSNADDKLYTKQSSDAILRYATGIKNTVINWLKRGPGDDCSNWLFINTNNGGVRIGDLDIPGTAITVEATFNRTQPPSQQNELFGGDLVSKHRGPESVNYLLRLNTAEITTDRGYFRTPDICDIELNKTYYVAMTYDGVILRFYRNGFLMSSVQASGSLFQNDFITTIGNLAYQPGFGTEGMLGHINEVRMWKTVRTQAELKTFLDKPLPSPTAQPGLLAYYTFDDLKNKQGNTAWNGSLINGAAINNANPTCGSYSKDSCDMVVTTPAVTPSFTSSDTVCVNTPVQIKNTTTGATNYYWSFCTADLKNSIPIADNIGNIDGALSQPVFMDLVSENGKYYAFLTNHYPGGLTRLDFGNSYLNTPKATSFGNFGGIIPSGYGTEGIQVVKNEGKWYAIIVAGSPPNNVPSRVIKIEIGTSIENPTPVATNWGNIGGESLPIDFYMFKDNDQWYGFTVNAYDNTITRIAFTNSFNNKPTGTNLGNVGNLLDYPTGVHAVNNEGKWSLFVTNAYSNKLVRLDFGTSLLNVPVAKDLGLSNVLNSPRDITIIKSCESTVGYIVNGVGNDIVQIDFNSDFNNIPTGKSLGNLGDLFFPHSISKLFRVNNDLYSFITNVNNNTITRLKFAGCTNASIAGSPLQNPPDIVYNKAGTYNITLTVDEGLATQSSVCRQVVVIAPPTPHPTLDTAFCNGSNINLVGLSTGNTYTWNTGASTKNIIVADAGKYWVKTDVYGCNSTDSFYVSKISSPSVKLGNDTALCEEDSMIVYAKNAGSTSLWQDGSAADSLEIRRSGIYSVAVTNLQGCTAKDTIIVSALPSPVLSGLQDKTICKNDAAQLSVEATGTGNVFSWQPDLTLSALNIDNPVASPHDTTTYYLTVENGNGCMTKDSLKVNVVLRPAISVRTDTTVCSGTAVMLAASAANANIFKWYPAENLSNNAILTPVATPTATTIYTLNAGNSICNTSDNLTINVMPLPAVTVNNDTTVCGIINTQLIAAGANTYSWFPSTGLSNAGIPNPVASPAQTVLYHVRGIGENGCVNEDSVKITVAALPNFEINPSKGEVCLGDSVLVNSSGGDIYTWDASPDVLQPNNASTFIRPVLGGIYKVIIANDICKIKDTLYTTLSVAQKPVITVMHSNDIDCVTNAATLTATGAVNYVWTPAGTLTNFYSSSPLAMPVETTVYHVKATGINGCTTEDSVRVEVKVANFDNAYQMATAFTPNNDGINDCFGVRKWSIVTSLDFSIYNRWGALIFHGNKVSDCWNGTYKGIPQAAGAYIYLIRAKTFCGNVYKKGTVVLLR